jgi:hypothetical protein
MYLSVEISAREESIVVNVHLHVEQQEGGKEEQMSRGDRKHRFPVFSCYQQAATGAAKWEKLGQGGGITPSSVFYSARRLANFTHTAPIYPMYT